MAFYFCENQCKCKVLYIHLKKENNDGTSKEMR